MTVQALHAFRYFSLFSSGEAKLELGISKSLAQPALDFHSWRSFRCRFSQCEKIDTASPQPTRLPEAEREGLHASLVGGKTCRAQKTADDAAYNKKACRKQGAIQTA